MQYAEATRTSDNVILVTVMEQAENGRRSVVDLYQVDRIQDVALFDDLRSINHVCSGVGGEIVETGALSLAEALEAVMG